MSNIDFDTIRGEEIPKKTATFSLNAIKLEKFKNLCRQLKINQSTLIDLAISSDLIPQLEKELNSGK